LLPLLYGFNFIFYDPNNPVPFFPSINILIYMGKAWKIQKQHQHLHILSLNANIKQTLNAFAIVIVTKD
jgi:hypothetical protein